MFNNWFQKLMNKTGYYNISQLKVGGTCGCCGKVIPNLIWVDYGSDNWDDIGICKECLQS